MEIIRDCIGLSRDGYAIDERLAEMSFGAWEGLTVKEIKSKFPGEWEKRLAGKWTDVPPGGESFADVAERLKAWIGDLSSDAIVVAHGAVGRIFCAGSIWVFRQKKLPSPATRSMTAFTV